MTWRVEWEPSALESASRYLADEPDAVDALLEATDQLAGDPRPASSRPWGTEHRRLRHGRRRVLYRIDADRVVRIEHVGRSPH